MELKDLNGKIIDNIYFDDDQILITFEDGSKLDLGQYQSCCEHRYFRTDDDTSYYIGATFYGLEETRTDSLDDVDYGCHEIGFVDIRTSKGVFTFCAHNEHNGYYGGTDLDVTISEPELKN